jgi:hypothetical protein
MVAGLEAAFDEAREGGTGHGTRRCLGRAASPRTNSPAVSPAELRRAETLGQSPIASSAVPQNSRPSVRLFSKPLTSRVLRSGSFTCVKRKARSSGRSWMFVSSVLLGFAMAIFLKARRRLYVRSAATSSTNDQSIVLLRFRHMPLAMMHVALQHLSLFRAMVVIYTTSVLPRTLPGMCAAAPPP